MIKVYLELGNGESFSFENVTNLVIEQQESASKPTLKQRVRDYFCCDIPTGRLNPISPPRKR